MATYINGTVVPQINWNAVGSMPKPYLSRDEKINVLQEHFFTVYKKEMGEKLPLDTKGIVVVQFAKYPNDMGIYINPDPTHYCEMMAVDMPKPLKQRYVFESRTFWLENGELIPLINGKSVLMASASKAVAKKIAKLQRWERCEYSGEFSLNFGRQANPYRIWEAEKEGERIFLCISLLNGTVFIVPEMQMPEKVVPEKKKFRVGAITIAPDREKDSGDYTRY